MSQELGAIARPDDIRFADNLPKTRSGKIMRRLLRTIARGEEITQDVSTLENPAILDQLRGVDAPGRRSAVGIKGAPSLGRGEEASRRQQKARAARRRRR